VLCFLYLISFFLEECICVPVLHSQSTELNVQELVRALGQSPDGSCKLAKDIMDRLDSIRAASQVPEGQTVVFAGYGAGAAVALVGHRNAFDFDLACHFFFRALASIRLPALRSLRLPSTTQAQEI
jgi:hypothetical protein